MEWSVRELAFASWRCMQQQLSATTSVRWDHLIFPSYPPARTFFGPPNAQIPKTPPSIQKQNGPAPLPKSPRRRFWPLCRDVRKPCLTRCLLLDLVLEAVAGHQVGDVVLISLPLLALLHVLVALGKLAERRERVGAELVEDTGDELRELLVLTVAVDGECVCRDGGVDCTEVVSTDVGICRAIRLYVPLGAAK